MSVYVNESDMDVSEIDQRFGIVSQMEDSDEVLILPGGLGAFYDIFRAIEMKKDVLIYNRDMFFTSMLRNLYQSYESGYIKETPSEYVIIESEFKDILRKLEELENGKINDGKNGKLL